MCSQSIDSTVDVGTLLVCCGSCQELCLTPMQHVLTLTMGVQLSKLAMSRRRLSLAVLVCDNYMHGNVEQALGYGCVDGSVLAEFEQVAAARRAKSSGENPLQRGAKWNIVSGHIVLLCASSERQCNPVRARRTPIHEAVGPAAAEAAAECRSMNQCH